MGKWLRCPAEFIVILTLILLPFLFATQASYAQLRFEEPVPLIIEITDETDLSSRSYWNIGTGDLEMLSLFGIPNPDSESGERQLFRLRVTNDTDQIIESFNLHLSLFTDLEELPELELTWRGEEMDESRRFSGLSSQAAGPDVRHPVDIFENIGSVMLEPGGELLLAMEVPGSAALSPAGGRLGVQRLELVPEPFEFSREVVEGDLLVTEILPSARQGENTFQFVELYNSTHLPVDLKGLKLRTPSDQYRIRETLYLEPYETVRLVSEQPADEVEEFGRILTDLHLPPEGGRIDLIWDGHTVLEAHYGELPGSGLWQLENVERGIEGLLTSDDFRLEERPEDPGSTVAATSSGTRELLYGFQPEVGNNWIAVSPPGRIINYLDPEVSYWNGMDPAENQVRLRTGLGILTENRGDQGLGRGWYSVGPERPVSFTLELSELGTGWMILGNPYAAEMPLERIVPDNSELLDRALQVWDPQTQSFYLHDRTQPLQPWQAFFINRDGMERIQFIGPDEAAATGSAESENRSRKINLELRSPDAPNGRLTDRALQLLFTEGYEARGDRYRSEKLWPIFRNEEQNSASILYFIGQGDEASTLLAREVQPYQLERPVELHIGHAALNSGNRHTLHWDDFENIPDDWEITLTDLETGVVIDMRQENQYAFESPSTWNEIPEFSETPSIHPVQLDENRERFVLSIQPEPEIEEVVAEQEESRDRVELQPNFPNPFYPATTIRYYLPEEAHIVITVYNVVGQPVDQLYDGVQSDGEHDLIWNATGYPSGIYIVHLEHGNRVYTRKITLIR